MIPAALGRFRGEFVFRRICRDCNTGVGKCEEQVLRCAPEAFFRRMVQPVTKRRKRGRSWVGAGGMPPPTFTILHDDHQELVRLSDDGISDVTMIDQLIIADAQKGEFRLPLSPQLTANQLRRKIEQSGYAPSEHIFLHADQANCPHYIAMMRELWPGICIEERNGLDRGVHRVAVRVSFTFHADYYRAIAKIGFHYYYLLHTRRGIQGTEPEFTAIRDLIRNGGDHRPLFEAAGTRFSLPFGELSDGRSVLPSVWTHVVAADEAAGGAMAMVTLFMGPEHLAPVFHIRLATFASPIIVPDARCTHAYMYDPIESSGTHAGRVKAISSTRLR